MDAPALVIHLEHLCSKFTIMLHALAMGTEQTRPGSGKG